jgi:hypothetical protein
LLWLLVTALIQSQFFLDSIFSVFLYIWADSPLAATSHLVTAGSPQAPATAFHLEAVLLAFHGMCSLE